MLYIIKVLLNTGKGRCFDILNMSCFYISFIAVLICRYFENTENVAILIIPGKLVNMTSLMRLANIPIRTYTWRLIDKKDFKDRVKVFNATFNNISVIQANTIKKRRFEDTKEVIRSHK